MSRPEDFGDGFDYLHAPLALRLLMVPVVVASAVCLAIAYALEERALRRGRG